MKKILSALLVVAMIASMCAVFALPAAANDDGLFDTHGKASHEVPGYDGDVNSIPGYAYTNDGFTMTTADWTTGTPFSHVSTREKVDLKNGVYMQVRVDDFNYDAGDKWFNFNIWSQDSIDEGSGDTKFGTGVQTLIRPSAAGVVGQISWYTKAFTGAGTSSIADADKVKDAEGRNIFTLVVTYDPQNKSYNVTINGSKAPEKVIEYMNETYANNSEAHIGFTMYSNKKGGSQQATVLQFGESELTAIKPAGEGSKDAENHIITYDPIKDADTVAEGSPAIIMKGDKANSQLKGTPTSTTGSIISISEDDLIHVVGTKAQADAGVWNVKNDASYDIADFPVIMVVTKNFCSCGGDAGECWAYEEACVYLATGEEIVPSPSNVIRGLQPEGDAYFIGDDGYLIFFYDVSADLKTEENPEGKFEGRINATRFDFFIDMGTPGANEFDVVMQGFFRNSDDAVAYAEAYFAANGWDNGEGGEGNETESTPAVDTETESTPAVDTESESASESVSTEKTETEAKVETESKENTGDKPASGGCFGTVGFGAIAIVAVAAVAGFVTLKKKD